MPPGATRLVILQCDSGDMHSDLIACARYNITNEHNQTRLTDDDNTGIVHVLFIVQLPRIAGGCFVGFQVSWDLDFLQLCLVAVYYSFINSTSAVVTLVSSQLFALFLPCAVITNCLQVLLLDMC